MKLDRVEIMNYRSIKNETVKFDSSCKVLVGINESGKSNVLRALSMLSPKHSTVTSDERQPLPDENDTPEHSRIRFIFNLDKDDHSAIASGLHKLIKASESAKVVNDGAKDYTLAQLVRLHKEALYDVDIRKGSKTARYWTLKQAFTYVGEWKKPSATCPDDATYVDSDGDIIKINDFKLIKIKAEHSEIPEEYLTDASIEDILNTVGSSICSYMKDHIPLVVFWEYSDKDLLPTQVSLAKFTEDPSSFIPLKNMFILAGKNNISDEIKSAKARGVTVLDNLLKRVSLHATKYLADVWHEYKGVKFNLQLNGSNIMCSVSEENSFCFKDRSDGFKKFIAFLLSVSTTSHTDTLTNALILIDEPETGLHPSGARYLRDELLKISKKNLVVYSTHSIFMVDRHQIDRHLIVTKNREVTQLSVADEGNVVHEEVIFNAINYSTFEHLCEYNLLFEGRRDRILFQTYTKTYEKAFFKSIGVIHGRGVSTFSALVPTLELAERKAVVISDSDSAAKNAQKAYKQIGYSSEWKTYKEISPSCTAITGEDFLENEYIVDKFNALCAVNGVSLSVLSKALPRDDKLDYLKRQLSSLRTAQQIKDDMTSLKGRLFTGLKRSNIEERYSQLVDDIKHYIEKQMVA